MTVRPYVVKATCVSALLLNTNFVSILRGLHRTDLNHRSISVNCLKLRSVTE